jgi:hypothetical protein
MATTFANIRSLIRAAVLDTDSENPAYTNEALNSQINLQMLSLQVEQPSGPFFLASAETFTSDLSALDSLRLALRAALLIVGGTAQEFSHRSPVLTVSRKGGARELGSRIEELLDDIEGNRCPIAVDNEFNVMAQYCYRYINGINDALVSYDGSS